jgi:hypothetical protein
MNMNTEEEWWAEFERELAKMVQPNDPNPPPKPTMEPPKEQRWVSGNTYYTLADDRQFAVDADYPNAVGWNYE